MTWLHGQTYFSVILYSHFKDELKKWEKFHLEKFKRAPKIDNILSRLLPAYIGNDKWTLDDKLGYSIYAYAIARFISDTYTEPPIAISIQAPWGGGKTSLMRMVKAMLDRDAPIPKSEIREKKASSRLYHYPQIASNLNIQ